MTEASEFVVPSEIPWAEMIGEPLEELLYWLCDALGARDLEWRAGSSSGTSTDRGRDLEATFSLALPDGELRPERWWLQAKGRTSTVERSAVQQAVLDASADPQIATLVVATNSRFSNPTRDWIAERTRANNRPRVVLWDRDALERMVVKHPAVVARVAPGALSDHGRLAALAARFWDYTRLPSSADLKGLWSARGNLSFGWKEILALSAGEVANGEPRARSWPLLLDDEHLADALLLGLVNLPYLLQRAELQGTSWETLMAALRFVFGCALLRLPAEVVKALVEDPWEHFDEGTPSPEARTGLVDLLVVPLIRSLREELGDVCSTDCVRVMTDPVLLEPHLADPSYWDRYILEAHSVEFDPRVLTIENDNAICKVGFDLDGEHRCPLFGERVELGEALDAYSRVLAMRVTARREDLGISGAAD